MPLVKLSFRPGINKESTSYANEGGFFDGNWVRFRSGYAEKIGGWQNLSFTNTFKGVARSLRTWVTYTGDKLLGLGTSQKFYVEHNGEYKDITPRRTAAITLGASPIATTNGSRLVTITHSAHGAAAGTFVTITSTSSVGGLSISGEYEIYTTPDSNTFTIIAASAANAGATGGGTVTVTYDINAGSSTFTVTTGGWGAGTYGNGPWGQSTGVAASLPLRLWSQCNYGEDLIMAPRGGVPYYWDVDLSSYPRAISLADKANSLTKVTTTATSAGVGTAITVASTDNIDLGAVVSGLNVSAGTYVTAINFTTKVITLSAATTGSASGNYTFSYVGRQVPTETEAVFAADASKFIVCLGATPYEPGNYSTTYDPMLVRWADQDNCFEWIPRITNQSGQQRLTIGSYLVTAQNTRQEVLIWSDAALYSMQYLGPPYVFGFNLLADNISIASPNAVVSANGLQYFMGVDKFYMYSGRVDTLQSTVHEYVFGDLNREQLFQIVSGSNEGFNEIWWFYPSANSTINDRYVVYNYVENLWYCGDLIRTAWLDSPLRQYPMGAFSVQTTVLTAAINSTATSISVKSAISYPMSGTIVIDSEEISYASRTDDRLDGCVRAVNGTVAASHSAYATVSYKTANQVMYHEIGTDDQSSNIPAPIHAYIASADFDIGDGHNYAFVSKILPDLTFDGSEVEYPKVDLLIKARTNSGTNYISSSSPTLRRQSTTPVEQFTGYPVTPLNEGQVFTRVRGRQMQFRVESSDLGVAWQLGQMRIEIRPDGRRA